MDSDGNNDVLIPLWLKAGMTGLRPFEIAADCDPVRTRREYPGLIIQGGIDKRVDHLVPPDVSLVNYRYYSALIRAVVEDPERYLHEARRRDCWRD